MSKKNPIKYIYKDKEAYYAKYIFGEMTLRDVLNIAYQRSYSKPTWVAISFDQEEKYTDYSFRLVGEELHIYKRDFYYHWENPHILFWFDLNEQVKVCEDEIEVKPLKGTRAKLARLKLASLSKREKTINILNRTKPNQD